MRKGIYQGKESVFISTRVKINGEWKSVYIRGYKTKRQANDDFDRAVEQWKRDHSGEFAVEFFGDLLKDYEKNRERIGISIQTRVNCDQNDFYHMKEFNGKLLKDVFSERSVKKWYERLLENNSANMANKVIGRFQDLYNFAFVNKLIDSGTYQTVVSLVRHIKADRKPSKEKIAWSMEEEQSFLNAIQKNSRNFVLFTLYCYLGCRIGEFIALKVKDYDPIHHQIIFSHQIIERTGIGEHLDTDYLKTATSYRAKPLPEAIYKLLEAYIKEIGGEPDRYLFTPSWSLKPISKNAIRRMMTRYCKLAGVRRNTPHGLKHTMATWLGSKCYNITDVAAAAKMQGNTVSVFLETYANHVKAEDQDLLIKRVQEQFSDSKTISKKA